MLESWRQDVRFAVRLLRQSPLFALIAAGSLAIGVGANATIFSVASALLIRPLPGLADSDRLADIGRSRRGEGFDTVSYPNYRDFAERTRLFEGVFAIRLEPRPMSLGGPDGAERVYGTVVSGNFFTVLGTRAFLGRTLHPDDDRPAAAPVAVMSHDLWQRRFGSDPRIAGREIVLNAHHFTVVGVAPPGFQGTTLLRPDLWVPIARLAEASPRSELDLLTSRPANWLVMGGRLRDGVSVAQARAEAAAIGAALEREYPKENEGTSFAVAATGLVPGRSGILAGFMAILFAITGLVLLVACANVAGMLLARGAGRRREIAVRASIGAGRGRLIRQLLTETVILFSIAGVAGVLISGWLTSLLVSLLPALPVPLALDITTDWRVVAFATVVSLATAVLSGLAPALQISRSDLVQGLKAEGLDQGSPRLRLRNAFVVGQLTLSLVLLVTGGLLVRALQNATTIEPGFDDRHVDVVSMDLSLAGLNADTGVPFLRDLLARVAATPGVETATAAVDLPLDGGRFGLGRLRAPRSPVPEHRDRILADWNVVDPGYFRAIRLPVSRGRDFGASDTRAGARVVIVSDALARDAWPGQDPIGQTLEMDGASGWTTLTVVGVTADAKLVTLNERSGRYVYVPLGQHYMSDLYVVVRRSAEASAVPLVRGILREMNPNLPITQAMPLSEITAIGIIPQRIAAAVAGSLGVIALLLAAMGVFGVTSYAVARRTREIGIRMALGADGGNVRRLVLKQAVKLAAIGITAGMALAALGSFLLESLLFGIRPLDPLTFGAAALIFATVTLLASYLPARRASAVDPMVALRNE